MSDQDYAAAYEQLQKYLIAFSNRYQKLSSKGRNKINNDRIAVHYISQAENYIRNNKIILDLFLNFPNSKFDNIYQWDEFRDPIRFYSDLQLLLSKINDKIR